jgi:hypothetical protein
MAPVMAPVMARVMARVMAPVPSSKKQAPPSGSPARSRRDLVPTLFQTVGDPQRSGAELR